MNLGGSLLVTAVGAILTFAVNVTLSGLNIHVVGVVLMVVGIAWLIISLSLWASRRNRRLPPVAGGIVEERRTYQEAPLYDEPPLG